MRKLLLAAVIATVSANAFAVTIDFNNLADDDVLGSQYAGLTFSAGHTTAGITPATGSFATNSSMLVHSTDLGGLGTPPLLSGIVVHSFGGWLSEDGDPTMTIDFPNAISSISLDFGGVAEVGVSGLYAIDSMDNVVSSVVVSTVTGQETLTLNGLNVNRVVVVMGSFNDWVGVDNLNYTEAVPEPATMMVLGAAALAAAARKRRK